VHILTKTQKIFIITLTIGYILFSIICILTSVYVPYNLFVQDKSLNGTKLIHLKETLDDIEDSLLNEKKLIIEHEDETFSYNVSEVGIFSNKEQIEADILAIYDKNFLITMHSFLEIFLNSKKYSLNYKIHEDLFLENIRDIDKVRLGQPINAEFEYIDGKVTIIQEVNGTEVDKEKLIGVIANSKIDSGHLVLELPFKDVVPEITSHELAQMGINEIIGEFTTVFNPNLTNRTNNLILSTGAINGKILAPGEIFSFNETVGQRTIESGYKASPIYVGDTIRDGVGGGICQVSSTIYNAVLLADLKVIERRNHSLTVPYVQLSRDATVSWGTVDFKFKNNTDNYIYIYGNIENNQLTIELHGTNSEKTTVLTSERLSTISPKTTYIYDKQLSPGKEIIVSRGTPGYTSRLIKETYIDDELILREVISTDRYLPTTTIIRRGR